MPRVEAAEIEAVVSSTVKEICPGVRCQACGSFRRGKVTCGDVDVLICPPSGQKDCEVLQTLLVRLHVSGFLTDDLALPGPHVPGHPQAYMGVCKLPGDGRKHRRLDIKVYPASMYAFAILYFTGSDHFNRSMRVFANLRGLVLSDRGLSPVNCVGGEKVHRFPSYRCPTERDVFVALGLEYVPPKERSV
ncbi:unnamed protein product [Discosporangium mesarthrocarpum]